MQTEHIDDLIAGYALNALDEAERVRCEQHTAICPPCQQEAAAARETAQMLGFVAAAVPPPLTCKRKLFEKIEREQFLATPARRQRPRPAIATWVAALSVALLVLTGGWGLSLQQQLAQARRELEAERAEMQPMRTQIAQYASLNSLFRDPEVIRTLQSLDQPSAGAKTFMRSGANDATLVVWGLPKLPPGKVYKVWVARGDQQQPLDSFEQTEPTMFLHIAPPEPMDRYKNIMITIEDDPSATKPSDQTVLLGEL